jgi:sugar lactone lactonase YvrE
MRKARWVYYLYIFTGIFLLLACITSCEKTEYNLLDPETAGKWQQFNSSNSELPGNLIFDIDVDPNGDIWATCYGKGLARYHDGIWSSYTSANSSINSNYVTGVEPVSDGIFIGTDDGFSIRLTTGAWFYIYDPSVSYMAINTIKADSKGSVWFGTQGEGYYYFDGTNYSHYLSGYDVKVIEEDRSGTIWIGTDRGLFKYNGTHLTPSSSAYLTSSNGLPSSDIISLYSDSRGRMWIGTYGGKTASWVDNKGLHQLNLMNGYDSTAIWDIQEDKKGDIWFATYNGGLIRYDGVVPHAYKAYNTLSFDDDITCLCEDLDGNIWIGTRTKGVFKYSLPLE